MADHRIPIWTPLGVEHTKHGPRYWLLVRGKPRRYRAGEMYGITFLAEVYPYLEHWRRSFPYGVGRRIDTHAACSFMVRECERVGEYVPTVTGA